MRTGMEQETDDCTDSTMVGEAFFFLLNNLGIQYLCVSDLSCRFAQFKNQTAADK